MISLSIQFLKINKIFNDERYESCSLRAIRFVDRTHKLAPYIDGYQKKKYVCKLLFIFLLGHDIDFGQIEAVNLLSSNKYTEKQIVSHTVSVNK